MSTDAHMTCDQLREVVERLDWSTRLLADLMGRDSRLVRHWLSGETPIPHEVAVWIRKVAAVWAEMPPSKRGTQRDENPFGPVPGFSREKISPA